MFSRTIIIGRLGHDPELRTTKNGNSVATLSVAVTTGFGENKKTEWFNVSAFGKMGENAAKYLKKGALACISGELHTNAYTSKDGKERIGLNLTADSVTFLSSPQNSADPSQPFAQAPSVVATTAPAMSFTPQTIDYNDDIPF